MRRDAVAREGETVFFGRPISPSPHTFLSPSPPLRSPSPRDRAHAPSQSPTAAPVAPRSSPRPFPAPHTMTQRHAELAVEAARASLREAAASIREFGRSTFASVKEGRTLDVLADATEAAARMLGEGDQSPTPSPSPSPSPTLDTLIAGARGALLVTAGLAHQAAEFDREHGLSQGLVSRVGSLLADARTALERVRDSGVTTTAAAAAAAQSLSGAVASLEALGSSAAAAVAGGTPIPPPPAPQSSFASARALLARATDDLRRAAAHFQSAPVLERPAVLVHEALRLSGDAVSALRAAATDSSANHMLHSAATAAAAAIHEAAALFPPLPPSPSAPVGGGIEFALRQAAVLDARYNMLPHVLRIDESLGLRQKVTGGLGLLAGVDHRLGITRRAEGADAAVLGGRGKRGLEAAFGLALGLAERYSRIRGEVVEAGIAAGEPGEPTTTRVEGKKAVTTG
jgi:hypothetical protein